MSTVAGSMAPMSMGTGGGTRAGRIGLVGVSTAKRTPSSYSPPRGCTGSAWAGSGSLRSTDAGRRTPVRCSTIRRWTAWGVRRRHNAGCGSWCTALSINATPTTYVAMSATMPAATPYMAWWNAHVAYRPTMVSTHAAATSALRHHAAWPARPHSTLDVHAQRSFMGGDLTCSTRRSTPCAHSSMKRHSSSVPRASSPSGNAYAVSAMTSPLGSHIMCCMPRATELTIRATGLRSAPSSVRRSVCCRGCIWRTKWPSTSSAWNSSTPCSVARTSECTNATTRPGFLRRMSSSMQQIGDRRYACDTNTTPTTQASADSLLSFVRGAPGSKSLAGLQQCGSIRASQRPNARDDCSPDRLPLEYDIMKVPGGSPKVSFRNTYPGVELRVKQIQIFNTVQASC
eukprot:m.961049 g.961049  ORF g.961049 m.961049 type:complete len:399 (+) comp23887_c0_seq13:1951-3147(+)